MELRQCGRLIRLIVRNLLQTQDTGYSSIALRPGAGIDRHVAVVEPDERALSEIEALAIWSAT